MYELVVEEHFAAAHSLRNYNGDCENLHGHNWKIEVYVQSKELNEIGLGIDFRELKKIIKEVLKLLDHKFLNEIDYFKDKNPSTENISRFIYEQLKERLKKYNNLKIVKVVSWEEEKTGAAYFEE